MSRPASNVLALLLGNFVALSASACGPSEVEAPGAPAVEHGGLASGAGEAAEAARPCESAPEMSDTVAVVKVAEPLPEAHGGPLPNGVHVLVAHEIYTGFDGQAGPTGQVRRQALRLTSRGHNPRFTDMLSVDGGPAQQRTFSLRVSGSSIGVSQSCPAAEGFAVLGYTIRGDSLLLIDPASRTVAVFRHR